MKKDYHLTKLTPDATLSQLINADQQAAELLTSIGLNPHNHKNQTLRSVCQQRQWNEVEVLQWIKKQRHSDSRESDKQQPGNPVPDNDLSEWSNFLKNNFHAPNLRILGEISDRFPRVLQIHGNQYPWLKNMQWHFEQFEEALNMYYEFQTNKFFPLLERWQKSNENLLDGTVRHLDRCLNIIDRDQQRLHRFMKTLAEKAHNFDNPAGVCSTLRILNQNLKNLFNRLEEQFETERKVLLPAVKEKMKTVQL